MYRLLPILLLATLPALAEHWIEYRIGPFHVFSDAGDKAARDRLNEMEQLRHVLGVMLGKDSLGVGGPQATQLDTVWPIDLILFSNEKQYAPHAPAKPLTEGGSAMLAAWTADVPLAHDLLRALTRMLIDENSGRMPDTTETALCDLLSTIQTKGTKVMIGAAPGAGELPPERMRAWARLQMIVTSPDMSGKLRVYLNNLQGVGDETLAARNAFGLTPAKLNEMVDAYVRTGKFTPAPADGEALDPNRDFIEKNVEPSDMDALMAELAAGGKNFPSASPRGLVAQGTRTSLELAAKRNPKWGEPYFQLAPLEETDAKRVEDLKTAAKLDPRNIEYWEELARAQTLANQYEDAQKSWTAALKVAGSAEERERIRQVREDLDDKRAEWEAAEKKRIAAQKAAELQRIKDAAAAEVHAAEAAANKQLGPLASKQKPVDWWEAPAGEKISGKLARVDCLAAGAMRLTINIDGGGVIRLLIRDLKSVQVKDVGETKFACGIAKPVRAIRVVYNVKADAKLNTVGEIAMVDFP
jgi:hypothetical protein